MHSALPSLSVHEILQAVTLEWGDFASPGDLPHPGIPAWCRFFTAWATREASRWGKRMIKPSSLWVFFFSSSQEKSISPANMTNRVLDRPHTMKPSLKANSYIAQASVCWRVYLHFPLISVQEVSNYREGGKVKNKRNYLLLQDLKDCTLTKMGYLA